MNSAELQATIQGYIQTYALPGILGYLEGLTEPQFHAYMRTKPDFIAKFRQNNRVVWDMVMHATQKYKGQIYLNAEVEANRLCWVIRNRRGFTCYRSEYECFASNIRRLIHILNS